MKKRTGWLAALLLGILAMAPGDAWGMHIMEGFLPWGWALFWVLLAAPFLLYGMVRTAKVVREHPEMKMLLGLAGAFAFVLSALKLPSVAGSSSHPTGTGLGAVLFGPFVATVMAFIVLLFQALLLAHGGLTTLGANLFAMGVAGPLAAYGAYRLGSKAGLGMGGSVFVAAFLGDLVTYLVTALQLALAFPAAQGGIAASFGAFLGVFAWTQIPLAITEGLLAVVVFNFIRTHSREELQRLQRISGNRGEVLSQ